MFDLSQERILAVPEHGAELNACEVRELSSVFKSSIKERGLVFFMCRNHVGALAGYVAMIECRMLVPVLLDAEMDREMLEGLIESYRPDYFWCANEYKDRFGTSIRKIMEFRGYSLLKNLKANKIPVQMYPDLALLLTTSGSTGSPKFVRLTYRNLEANAQSISEYLGITNIERPITSLPMHYSYGLSVINSHLIRGAELLLTERSVMEKEFWAFFREKGATSLAGVPYSYQMLKRLRLQRMNLPSLKTLTQAGGKLSADLVSEFAQWSQETGRRFFVMYGQTEATARMSYLPWKHVIQKSSSIGIAIPGGQFSIIDTQGKVITEPEVAGELQYRGDNVSLGYAESPDDLILGDENHGVLRTGDVAERDADGYYYIVGRLKRFIKIFGNRVNLDQVEQLARVIWADSACTGIDDKLTVYVTNPEIIDQMRAYLVSKTGLHSSAVAVKCIQEIPKNSSGKTQYSLLQ